MFLVKGDEKKYLLKANEQTALFLGNMMHHFPLHILSKWVIHNIYIYIYIYTGSTFVCTDGNSRVIITSTVSVQNSILVSKYSRSDLLKRNLTSFCKCGNCFDSYIYFYCMIYILYYNCIRIRVFLAVPNFKNENVKNH